jgi:hypothetical protein
VAAIGSSAFQPAEYDCDKMNILVNLSLAKRTFDIAVPPLENLLCLSCRAVGRWRLEIGEDTSNA